MIGKIGHYLLEINNDELDSHEVRHLKVIEDAGLGLPIMFLEFMTEDEEKIKRYNTPGYHITIGMGVTSIEYTSTFRAFTTDITNAYGADRWIARIWSVLSDYTYLTQQRMEHYYSMGDKRKSSEVWSIVMQRVGLTPVTQDSNDKMLWIQHNITDRKFLEELTWHGFFKEEDPALHGIRRNAEAVYLPLSALMKKKGTIGNTDDVDIKTNNITSTHDEGFLTSWSGKKRRVPIHTMEGGDDVLDIGEVEPKITNEPGLIDLIDRTGEIERINDNVHMYWWKARRQNMQYKSSLSATSMSFLCNEYHPIFLLDMYEVILKRQHGARDLLTPYNGNWLISNIVTSYTASSFQMHIKGNRETLL